MSGTDKQAGEPRNKAVKTVSLIIFATAFSKILGLVRDMVMAYLYGGSTENAAMTVALDIPLSFFDIFFGAAILGVFIPVYNSFGKDGKDGKDGGDNRDNHEEKAEEFANVFLNFVILATGLLVLLGIVFAGQIVDVMAAGAGEETKRLTVYLLRIMLPMIVFTGSVFTVTGILQSKGEFLAPALVSSFSNLCVIIYFLAFNRHFGIYGLAVAYLISWMIQLLTLAVPLSRKKHKYKFKIDFKNPAFMQAAKLAPPVLAGSWLIPMSKQIANRFSTVYEDYALVIAAFGRAWSLFLIITGILAYGVCNYIFPKLARNANSGGGEQEFAETLKNGLSGLIFVIAPVACIAFVLREEAVAVLFMRGAFTPDIAEASAGMFAFLTPAMLTFSLIEIMNRVFYSKKLVKFPMIAAVAAVGVNFALCYIFIELAGLAPVYITVANLICQAVALLILTIAMRSKVRGVLNKKFTANIAKIVLSSGIALIITLLLYFALANNAFESNLLKNIGTSVIILIAGSAVYLGANIVLRTSEARAILKILKREAG